MIPIEYIESTGTQFVTTPILASTSDLRFVAELMITGVTDVSSLSGDGIWAASWVTSGYLFIRFGGSPGVFRWHSGGAVSQDVPVVLNHRYAIETNKSGLIIDDIVYSLPSHSGTDVNVPVSIFKSTQGTTGNLSKMRLYSCKVYSGNNLLADYIPALDEANVACLYDTVSETYLHNAGTGTFIAGDPVLEYYTVIFDSDGGSGDMTNQRISIDTETPLTLNSFTKEGYIFSGWALTPGGDAAFSDGESVLNLAGENETITLYAVWIPKPIEIILQHNKTDNNHLDKEVETISTLYGVFRDEFTVTDPVIMLQGDVGMITGVNYFTIPVLGRSYFLTACDVVALNLIRIKGHVDVLSSFSESIRAQKVIIRRAESSGAYNLYLNDGSLRTYSNPYVLTEPFPAGFTSPSFVLAVAGSAST